MKRRYIGFAFIALVIIAVSLTAFNSLKEGGNSKLTSKIIGNDNLVRNIEENTAEAITLEQIEGEYVVGKDFKPGFYDIKANDENGVTFAGYKLRENEEVLALQFWDKNKISIAGQGKVQLIPAKFEKLNKQGNDYFLAKTGYYMVGEELPEGTYDFILKDSQEPLDIFIDIRNADGEPVESIQWDKKTNAGIEVPIKLTKGYMIYIDKTNADNNQREDISVTLEKAENKSNNEY